MSAEGASSLEGSGGVFPQKFLRIRVSKMAISSILRQISYSFNRIHDVFIKIKMKEIVTLHHNFIVAYHFFCYYLFIYRKGTKLIIITTFTKEV